MTTIIVSGAVANKYLNAGATWTRLSWVLGFKKLGFRVHFLEQISRESCVDRNGSVVPFRHSVNLAYFKAAMDQFELSDSATLIYQDGEDIYGSTQDQLLHLADGADLLVNITGHLTLESLFHRLRQKVYIDLDPGFTQFWHSAGQTGPRLDGHDHFFTVGENIGTRHCSIPSGGIPWRPIRQPVVLEHWPVCDAKDKTRFTTVAAWRGPYGPIEHNGKTYGVKVHEFRKFIQLPTALRDATFEIVLDIHPSDDHDLRQLRQHGWRIENPKDKVPDPARFQEYVQRSGAEFSVAQGIYVATHSGWFSDRTVRYLASGKPALVQETGFSRHLPVGQGLISFSTLAEAIEGAERIRQDYELHSRSARTLAEEFFDSDKVLGGLIEQVGVSP